MAIKDRWNRLLRRKSAYSATGEHTLHPSARAAATRPAASAPAAPTTARTTATDAYDYHYSHHKPPPRSRPLSRTIAGWIPGCGSGSGNEAKKQEQQQQEEEREGEGRCHAKGRGSKTTSGKDSGYAEDGDEEERGRRKSDRELTRQEHQEMLGRFRMQFGRRRTSGMELDGVSPGGSRRVSWVGDGG